MYLKKIVIENFKGHKHCELEFGPGFNLLIGDNGMGKTSILEAASVGLGGYIAGIDDVLSKHFTKDEIRVSATPMGDGSFHRQYETPVFVTCIAELKGKEYQWTRRKSSVKASRDRIPLFSLVFAAYIKNANQNRKILQYLQSPPFWFLIRKMTTSKIQMTLNRMYSLPFPTRKQ